MPHSLAVILSKIYSSKWRSSVILFLLALLLGFATVNRGLQSDDYIHRDMLLNEDSSTLEKLNQFFQFLGPTEYLPWWTQKDLKIHFWRPLSALSHWLDYQLWPDSPFAMHVHSVVWYALLCLLVFLTFSALNFSPFSAFLVAMIFTLDFSHFANLSWIANRNSLISSCFILLSFIFYLHWRNAFNLRQLLISTFFLACALLSGEAGLGLIAIVIAYECTHFLYKASVGKTDAVAFQPWPHLSGLGLLFLTAALWFWFYQQSGFGVANNSMYFSPSENFLNSFSLLTQKLPLIFFHNITGIDGFYNIFSNQAKWWLALSIIVVIFIFAFLYRELFKQPETSFLLLATAGVSIPVCFVSVLDMRLLLLSSVFCSGIIVLLLQHPKENVFSKCTGALLLVSHIGVALTQWTFVGTRDAIKPPDSFASLIEIQKQYSGKNVFLINHPSPIDLYYFPFVIEEKSSLYVLNNNFSDYKLETLENGFLIENQSGLAFRNSDVNTINNDQILDGIYARSAFNGLISESYSFTKGQLYFHPLFTVKILETTNSGLANKIQYAFNNNSTSFSTNENIFLIWDSSRKHFQKLDEIIEQAQIPNDSGTQETASSIIVTN